MYILCTSPCFYSNELVSYDIALRETLSVLLNINLNDNSWSQATWPVWAGGLLVRSAATLVPSAFIASVESKTNLVAVLHPAPYTSHADSLLSQAVVKWQGNAPDSNLTPPSGSHKQLDWDRSVCNAISDHLLANYSGDPVYAQACWLQKQRVQVAGFTLCRCLILAYNWTTLL